MSKSTRSLFPHGDRGAGRTKAAIARHKVKLDDALKRAMVEAKWLANHNYKPADMETIRCRLKNLNQNS